MYEGVEAVITVGDFYKQSSGEGVHMLLYKTVTFSFTIVSLFYCNNFYRHRCCKYCRLIINDYEKIIIILGLGMLPVILFAQTGHLMQGIGAANMSMGGASTAQPLDINGALQWNPAAISAFDKRYFLLMQDYFFLRRLCHQQYQHPKALYWRHKR